MSLKTLLLPLGKAIGTDSGNRFFPKKVELQALMKYYDFNQDGGVSYEEFVTGLREPLTERRLKML